MGLGERLVPRRPPVSKYAGSHREMSKRKLLRKLLASRNKARFDDVRALVEAFGFRLVRISGSHHIFSHRSILGSMNLHEKAIREALSGKRG